MPSRGWILVTIHIMRRRTMNERRNDEMLDMPWVASLRNASEDSPLHALLPKDVRLNPL
jgi:hypothetical protein